VVHKHNHTPWLREQELVQRHIFLTLRALCFVPGAQTSLSHRRLENTGGAEGRTHCVRRSTMRFLLVKSNTSGGAGKFSAAISLYSQTQFMTYSGMNTAHAWHLSKLELLDSSSVIAMPSPFANVPFAPLLNNRV
jgi:hypothetical protein